MAALECRAVGTLEEAQLGELTELLIGLSGTQPEALNQHEVVLKAPADAAASTTGGPRAWKPDLRLQHDLSPSSSGRGDAASEAWTVLQFSLHLRGKQHAALPATVRHVTRTQCTGEDVPAFWQALGFAPHFQLVRRGHCFLVPLEGQEVQVSVCRVLRLQPRPASHDGSASQPAAAQQWEELSPGRMLVEAVACVPSEADHMASVAAVTALAELLQLYTTLQRPPRAPGEPM
ncbi:hypothetical protein D9Q98_003339 [Chlorella vulgaris]|uniref:Mediator of RNA polymerase II transcription subunit 18 n=1 Tax=Chlorella vulgaris TaxID=3077 RepID=A0A9D4TSC4_CHLVU|nr:hypothetical protein D9Q98_003339 [Chlorella vulgaris]